MKKIKQRETKSTICELDNELSCFLFSFYFLSHFYFIFNLFFIFLFLETLGLGLEVIGHTVTSVTFDGMVTTLIIGLKKRK